ncbi:MAG: permease-like cell division protein FtsX [Paludibacteraceae bacterium]|nr:permease-like cell division protein FtsX [Paludibacteraceae bacterium]
MEKSAKYKLFNSKLTAVISVAMVLVLLGITTMVLLMSKNLTDHVRENFIFKLTLKEGLSDKKISDLGDLLNEKSYIKAATFVSKDDAVKAFAEQLGEDPMESLNVNPLPNTFDVSLKAAHLAKDSLEKIEADLKALPEISEVDYPHDLVDEFTNNVKKVTAVFLLLAVVLLVISFALINNTIRLLIYSDRFLIHTMKQVGATRSFIRKPYMKQGFVIGVVSSLIAIAALFVILFCMGDMSEELELYLDTHNTSLCAVTFGVVLAAGIIITELSTYFAVNKYLGRSLNSLYLI